MISIAPSRIVREALKKRLANIGSGFNASMAQVAALNDVEPFEIDFTEESRNFFEARIDLDSIQKSSYDSPQFLTIWSAVAAPLPTGQRLIYHSFSGTVHAGIDVILQYISTEPLQDFESPADAVEQALLATINTPSNQADFQGCGYNGDMTISRTPVIFGGQNWVQAVRCALSFEVHLQ